MRILYISSANGMSGSTCALLNILRGIQARGHEVKVVTTTGPGSLPEKLREMGCPFQQVDFRANVYPTNSSKLSYLPRLLLMVIKNVLARRRMREIVRAYAPDLVHTNVGPVNVAAEVCHALKVPHVWHQREYKDKDFNLHIFPTLHTFLRQTHREGNYNICITKGVFEYSHFRPDVDRVIYDGVFPAALAQTPRRVEKEKYVLFAGRITPGKNPLEVIRVFARFHALRPDYRLLLAGYYIKSNYVRRCFRAVKELHLEDAVDFLGERQDVYALMARAAMLVVPSLFEGFGFITAEAMLNYCPVIGRDTAGTKEQFDIGLEMTGREIGLRYLSEDDLLKAMLHVADNDMSDMCDRAHGVVTAKYTLEQHVDQIEAYYRFVLHNESAR